MQLTIVMINGLLKNQPQMVQFSKFKLLYTLKFNFNGGQFYKEISKLGCFKKWEQVRTRKTMPKLKAKNGPIFKIQVSICTEIKF